MHYCLIGFVTKDIVPGTPDGFLWGGTVTYSGRVVAQLGEQVSILTAAEPDPHLAELDPHINWHITPDSVTTTFVNQYHPLTGKRHQQMLQRAQNVPLNDLAHLSPPPDIVHLAPLAHEVDPLVVKPLLGPDSWLVATPQGWMRRVDSHHVVHKIEWEQAFAALPVMKAVVFSDEDVEFKDHLPREYARTGTTILYTRGPKGAILYHAGEEIPIKAAPTQVVDPTGAGDVIAASFFIRFRETGDPLEAAIFGTAAASISLEHVGTTGLPNRAQIAERLRMWPEKDRLGHSD
jgi:sugar/nucleoside kinase (ribokinase family)